ncbi:MAG: toprim domain-containing protein [Crenarchaeota archaeon]|nr:toprim domain-containing protein [Thermoproteota archaeon]
MPRLRKTGSRRDTASAESVGRIIQELNLGDAGRLIVVEGTKDRQALVKLGVKARIMTLRGFIRLAATDWLEKKKFSEIVILTDFDRMGRSHSVKIRKICSGRVRVNTEYKYRLKQALGGSAKEVEGIPSFIRNKTEQEVV